MMFDPLLKMCMMMRRSILGLLYVPAVSCLLSHCLLTRPKTQGNDMIGHLRWCCAGSDILERIRQATQSRDGTDAISSSRWIYFCIGEISFIPFFSMLGTIIKKKKTAD